MLNIVLPFGINDDTEEEDDDDKIEQEIRSNRRLRSNRRQIDDDKCVFRISIINTSVYIFILDFVD